MNKEVFQYTNQKTAYHKKSILTHTKMKWAKMLKTRHI